MESQREAVMGKERDNGGQQLHGCKRWRHDGGDNSGIFGDEEIKAVVKRKFWLGCVIGKYRGTGVLRQQAGEGWEEDNLGCRGGRGWKRGRKVRTTGGSGWATTEEKGRWYGLQTRRQQRGEKGRWCGLRPRRQQHGEKGRWQRQVVAAKDGDDDNDGNVDGKESSCEITTRKPRIAL
ncbi:hypothetical protein BHM03_00014028 [Ensete ventricosum]|nr:hypothetical protein BHM03_00014028 [Ensete ventricosum]